MYAPVYETQKNDILGEYPEMAKYVYRQNTYGDSPDTQQKPAQEEPSRKGKALEIHMTQVGCTTAARTSVN